MTTTRASVGVRSDLGRWSRRGAAQFTTPATSPDYRAKSVRNLLCFLGALARIALALGTPQGRPVGEQGVKADAGRIKQRRVARNPAD